MKWGLAPLEVGSDIAYSSLKLMTNTIQRLIQKTIKTNSRFCSTSVLYRDNNYIPIALDFLEFRINCILMPEQQIKADTKICHSTNSQRHSQKKKFVMQHLLHEGNWRNPSLG